MTFIQPKATDGIPGEKGHAVSAVELVNVVDQLAAIEHELATIRARENELREQKRTLLLSLKPYVSCSDYELLRGTRGAIRARRTKRITVPLISVNRTQAERFRLDLRSSGFWDTVSDVSIPRVKSLWKSPDRCPPQLRNCMQPYVTEESIVEVRRTA